LNSIKNIDNDHKYKLFDTVFNYLCIYKNKLTIYNKPYKLLDNLHDFCVYLFDKKYVPYHIIDTKEYIIKCINYNNLLLLNKLYECGINM
jgi:hypothetical protein